MVLKRMMKLILSVVFLVAAIMGCSSGSETGGGFAPYVNSVFFVSSRLAPNNADADGDIFSVATNGQGFIANLTESGTAGGDDEDYPCAVDLNFGRSRLIFVSERTDTGNVAGDVDIFAVPLNGGVISNLTDRPTTGDKDDACLGIVANTGSVVFESARTVDGESAVPNAGDLDIFVVSITTDFSGQIVSTSITNRTDEGTSGSLATDKLVWIGSSNLYFESDRSGSDGSIPSLPNADQDQHIFSVSSAGQPQVINLTHDGDFPNATVNGAVTTSTDTFCGLDSSERYLVFQSNRNQGARADGLQVQSTTTPGAALTPDMQDVFVRDLAVASSIDLSGINAAIGNLTDAANETVPHSSTDPQDSMDTCYFGKGYNSVATVNGNPLTLIVSGRTASGDHTPGGSGSNGFTYFTEFSNAPAQSDPVDIFSSTLSVTPANGVLNTLTNLTDGTSGDTTDTLLHVCGTKVIFASSRTDLAPGSSGTEDDLFSVDLADGTIVNRSNGASGDANDVFVCCNFFSDRLIFASKRTDLGNANGDVDLFETTLGVAAGEIFNLTHVTEGDGNDGFADIGGTFAGATSNSGTVSGIGMFGTTTGHDFGLDPVPALGFDMPTAPPGATYHASSYAAYGVGCNVLDQLIFVSERTQPNNSSSTDLDIFMMPILLGNGEVSQAQNIINLTDNSDAGQDALDGIGAIDSMVSPLF